MQPGYFGLELSANKPLAKNINCYDNSVLYNDFVIASLLKTLRSKNGISSLIYLSDHPEDVFSEFGHNSDKFTFPMTQIPLLMWFSEAYRHTYADKFFAMEQNSEALFGNDFLYDSLIGITFACEFDPHFFRSYRWEPIPILHSVPLISRESGIDGNNSFTWIRTDSTNEYVDSTLILEPLFIINNWDLIASDMPDTTYIKITHAKGILASGELVDLRGDSLSVIFRPQTVSAKDLPSRQIKVYPNPSDGTIYITGDHVLPDSEYLLFDINGRLASSGNLDGFKVTADLPPGVYVLSLHGEFPSRALVVIQ